MYVIASIVLDGEEYEVGAEVESEYGPRLYDVSYEVGEPEVSAPDSTLKLSRLIDSDTLPRGWSDLAQEALIEEYQGAMGDAEDARADYEYDRMREDDDS